MKLGNSKTVSRFLNFAISIIGLVFVDQITKAIFFSRDFFIAWMHFHGVKNFGLSFGLDFGIANMIVIIVALILFISNFPEFTSAKKINWGLILIFAGAAGNLVDRFRLGFVRDFWDIGLGFTFNLADVFIFIGLIMLLFGRPSESEQLDRLPQKND